MYIPLVTGLLNEWLVMVICGVDLQITMALHVNDNEHFTLPIIVCSSIALHMHCNHYTCMHAVPPMITMPDSGQRLVVNQTNSAIFDCSATGIPTPLIQWYRGDLLLNGTGPGINARVNVMNSASISLGELGTVMSTLTISDTIGNDSANYTCVATNELTNFTEILEERSDEIIELFVQGKYIVEDIR